MSRSDRATEIAATGWRVNTVNEANVREVIRDGREYLRFPLIPLREMVYNYPERGTNEYLPAAHISETAEAWDGTLLTSIHPENRYRTVRDPESFMGDVIGAVHDPELLNGGSRLKVSGLIDVAKANALGGHAARLVDLLRRGEEVSVSAGYATMDDEHRPGTFDGETYQLVQGPPLPDHVAIFPSDTEFLARCTPEDGCVAPRANAYQQQNETNGVSTNMSETASNGGGIGPTNDDGERLATREEFEELKAMVADLISLKEDAEQQANAVPGQCGCDTTANYGAVPGPVARDYDDRGSGGDLGDWPAGGRQAWERRQVGLDEVPDEKPVPAGGRSDYEWRQVEKATTNTTPVNESSGGGVSTGTRSSYETRRANAKGRNVRPHLAHDYPVTAKRQMDVEEERERREKLERRARRNG